MKIKQLLGLFCLLVALCLTSCSGVNDKMEKMIPSDVTGVVAIDLPALLEKASIIKDGQIQYSAALQKLIDANDSQLFCSLLNDLPVMGLDSDAKVYLFTSTKTFSLVALMAVDQEDKAKKVVAQRLGQDFSTVEGLSSVFAGDYLCAIDGNVMLLGRMGNLVDQSKATLAAKSILKAVSPSILENDKAKEILHGGAEISAYLTPMSIASLKADKLADKANGVLPLLTEFLAQADFTALTLQLKVNASDASLQANILADDSSDFMKLMNTVLAKPSSDFLKAVPVSMNHILSISVNGNQLASLPLMDQFAEMLKKMSPAANLDVKTMVANINGPLVVAGASDPHLPGVWNVVAAAQCTSPDSVLKPITSFAEAVGQSPEMYNNEYLYQYDNKMVKLGTMANTLYLKMLDYDMEEESAASNQDLVTLFGKSPFALSCSFTLGSAHSFLRFGMSDARKGEGLFMCDDKNMNAAEALLMTLCSLKISSAIPADPEDEGEGLVPRF